ncbi:MAG TPA: DUF933 domain-containing protein [Armatimonadota bacterium]|nr:DUF933 domain-containing protein [Armatimonadota bacterium]HQK91950.1 DUF933 domain-containing protein [Armatimonadota bacterium]
MRIGLVGLPGSGKTTIFNLLTGLKKDLDGSTHGRTEPNVGVLKVPDPRLERLAEITESKRKVQAEVALVDVLGARPSRGASGLGAEDVARHVEDADAFCVVIGAFAVDGPGAVAQLEDVLLSLALADLAKVERRLERVLRDIQRGKKEGERERALLEHVRAPLEAGVGLAKALPAERDRVELRGFQFLSAKPVAVLENVRDDDAGTDGALADVCRLQRYPHTVVAGRLELEIAELPPEEQLGFLSEYGIRSSARERCISSVYEALDAVTFYTIAHGEARAWPVRSGTVALDAAGAVHSDMKAGFIRAEVIPFDVLAEVGSLAECRARGVVRLEGRDHVVHDGDIITFRFSS